MRILITGHNGQLGQALQEALRETGSHEVVGLSLPFDLAERTALTDWWHANGPFDRVIHCAAFTDVDGAEKQPDACRRTNVVATENLARLCSAGRIALLYISTDYVFTGNQIRVPLTPDAACTPAGVYATTKHDGELRVRDLCPDRHAIVRISGLFGPGGKNFVRAIVNALQGPQPELRVVDDQTCRVTYAPDLAAALARFIGAASTAAPTAPMPVGVFHAANQHSLTWHFFATAIRDLLGQRKPIAAVSSAELGRPAPRPVWSVFDTSAFDTVVGTPLPSWEDALERYLTREGWR